LSRTAANGLDVSDESWRHQYVKAKANFLAMVNDASRKELRTRIDLPGQLKRRFKQ
jgi:hypothetical protein